MVLLQLVVVLDSVLLLHQKIPYPFYSQTTSLTRPCYSLVYEDTAEANDYDDARAGIIISPINFLLT